jgi:hypothetical protein
MVAGAEVCFALGSGSAAANGERAFSGNSGHGLATRFCSLPRRRLQSWASSAECHTVSSVGERVMSLGGTGGTRLVRQVRGFFSTLYGSVPAEFRSAFALDESVARLAAVTREFPIFTRQHVAMGEVSKRFVLLRKPWGVLGVVPLRRTQGLLGWAPVFKGEFCEIDGQVQLRGRFGLPSRLKISMTIWLGGGFLWLVHSILATLAGHQSFWHLFWGIGLIALGVAAVWVSVESSRDDIPWLSQLIQHALSKNESRDIAT